MSMLILMSIVGFVFLAAGIFVCVKWGEKLYNRDLEWVYYTLNAIGAFVFSISLMVTLYVGVEYSGRKTIDDRIELYKQENANIESQVSTIVSEYMDFETETYGQLKNESLVVLVNLYPELKSDTLVKEQLALYMENNRTIKSLECERLKYRIYAWWLFFGS